MVAVKRKQLPEFEAYGSGDEDDPYLDGDDDVFLGFSRVFSGVLRPDSVRPALRCPYPSAPAECASRNLSIPCALALTCLPAQDVYVLGPKYDPGAPNAADNRVRLTGGLKLYLMMGRDLTPMDAAPAGAIVAIGGLERCVTPQLCATVRVGLLTTTPPALPPLACATLQPRAENRHAEQQSHVHALGRDGVPGACASRLWGRVLARACTEPQLPTCSRDHDHAATPAVRPRLWCG